MVNNNTPTNTGSRNILTTVVEIEGGLHAGQFGEIANLTEDQFGCVAVQLLEPIEWIAGPEAELACADRDRLIRYAHVLPRNFRRLSEFEMIEKFAV